MKFAPESVHQRLLQSARPSLAFESGLDLEVWRGELDLRLRDLVGVLPAPVPPDLRVEWTEHYGGGSGGRRNVTYGWRETRFVFTAEEGADVPCHLVVPDGVRSPVPVVICLQGHSEGMHNSLGRGDTHGDRDSAIQAVSRGFAALAIEQRCFGEREDRRPDDVRHVDHRCHHATHAAALLGRTMVGERVWDVMRAIDVLGGFPDVDTTRVGVMGNSTGGTIAWYAACLDSRITAVMPSCSVCTFAGSIGSIDHCCDHYLPGALRYFDMPDLAGLIAPRPLVVVTGRSDPLFPLDAVKDAFIKIQAIYNASDASDQCALVIGEGGHRFYADDAWPIFDRLTGWLSPTTP